MASNPSPSLWRGVFELGYVTNDIEHTVNRFRQTHGFTGFAINQGTTSYQSAQGEIVVGTHIALGYVDQTLVEIIQPDDWSAPNIYTDFFNLPPLSRPFARFHHLGFDVGDEQAFEQARAVLINNAQAPIIGEMSGGGIRCLYQDDRETSGHLNAYMTMSDDVRGYMKSLPRN